MNTFRYIHSFRLYGLMLLGLSYVYQTYAQVSNNSFNNLWTKIEADLEKPNADSSYQFILDEVKDFCKGDFDCLWNSYDSLQYKLEKKFKLEAAIKVTFELIKLAEQKPSLEKIAEGHNDLSRYYDAMNNIREATYHLDLSIKYYEKLGNRRKIILCNFNKIYRTTSNDNFDHSIHKLDSIINEARIEKDSILIAYLLSHLLPLKIESNKFDKVDYYFEIYRQVLNPNIKTQQGNKLWANYYFQKGRFLEKKDSLHSAKLNYTKSLGYIKYVEDPWTELNTNLSLVEIDVKLENFKEASDRMKLAFVMSDKLKSEDLNASCFIIASELAEAEGRFDDALVYLKKYYSIQEKINAKNDKKIVKNYYLEVENKNKEWELKQSKIQLNYSLVIGFLTFLIACGLLYGFYNQRKIRRELSLQNDLIQSQSEELKSLDQAKSRFFANVSHELRTPLTLLTGPIKTLLNENQLNANQTKLLQVADRSGKQLKLLIDEILDLRKLEMGKMKLNVETTPLLSYFQSYLVQFESLADEKQIQYKYKLDIPEEAIADIDKEKCRQLIYNLLSNAFKFTPSGGEIKAQVSIYGDHLELRISDNGSGIPSEDLPFVFDRYFQSNKPNKPAEGGTGIGLALCREYAQLFGGNIKVESSVGEGATFIVSFPIILEKKIVDTFQHVTEQSEANEPNVNPLNPIQLGINSNEQKLKTFEILLVEDNKDLQEYIQFILSKKYKVSTAFNGKVALQMLNDKTKPSLIISDLMMPVMDGYQLLEQLKAEEKTRHIPTIMLTARAEAQDRLKALRIGVDDYITKPFDEEELVIRIENLLKNQAARNEMASEFVEEPKPTKLMSHVDREWLETFEAYVQKHYSSDILSVSSLAYQFTMSESTLLRQLKRLTGLSPIQYILEIRLNEARRLLENRVYNSITQVASKVGYDDARSFSRSFKQRFGKLPSEMM